MATDDETISNECINDLIINARNKKYEKTS